jgi:prefoldin subunit 4
MEVRREDQEKINRFSSLHQKETALEEELRAKIVSPSRAALLVTHILIPRAEGEGRPRGNLNGTRARRRGGQSPVRVLAVDADGRQILMRNRYKVGDCFVSLPQPQVLELLEGSTEAIDGEVEEVKTKLEKIQEEMGELKNALYGRFGRSINLET